MIPADVASRIQVSTDTSLRPVAPTQEIADRLSGLVAGQKVMAEIQAALPNGTYRAIINQRSITLALPFSAKSGDSLELLVTESDGKLALAVVSRQEGESDKPGTASTTSTLSRTGQLISDLFSGVRDTKGGSVSLPLNGNQPIASAPPSSAQDLLPLLKQAITQSGMFYESHQAEWFEGRFTQAALLQEPQGKLSSPSAFLATSAGEQKNSVQTNVQTVAEAQATKTGLVSGDNTSASRISAETTLAQNTAKTSATQTQQIVAPQTQQLVQQQLEALATQNYSWQGQVWPGQEMRWEIDEDATKRPQTDDGQATQWSTRVRMTLPKLGEIDAQIRLNGNQVTLTMSAGDPAVRELMRSSSQALRQQLDEAGLTLASIGVAAVVEDQANGQANG